MESSPTSNSKSLIDHFTISSSMPAHVKIVQPAAVTPNVYACIKDQHAPGLGSQV